MSVVSICYVRFVGIRASKAIQKYSERVDEVLKQNRKLKPVLITFTVKNGSDLAERSNHLMKSFRTLLDRRRLFEKGSGLMSFARSMGQCIHTKTHTTKNW